MKVRIVHVHGSRAGQQLDVMGPVIALGRDPSCQVAFDAVKDDRVSARHAQITVQGANLVITDTNSRNGTYVNGQKLTQPTLLPPNAVVEVGEGGPKIMVQAMPDAPAPAPAPAGAPPVPRTAEMAAKKVPASGGGGGGLGKCLLLFGCFFLFLVLAGGGFAAWYFLYQQPQPGGTRPPDAPTAAPTTATAASPGPAPSTAETPKPAARPLSPWGKLAVGTVIETKSTTELKVPQPGVSEVVSTYTIKARDDREVTVTVEHVLSYNGNKSPPTVKDETYPVELQPTPSPDPKLKPTITKDKVDVPGIGTVACDKYTYRETLMGVEKSRKDVWIATSADLPFPVKMETKEVIQSSRFQMTKVKRPGP